MSKLLKGLELRGNPGGWAQPFTFTEATRNTLRVWLDNEAIENLQGLTKAARQIERHARNEPTPGDSLAVLERIQSLTAALSTALTQAPLSARAELQLIGNQALGDPDKTEQLALDLAKFSCVLQTHIAQLPKQGRGGVSHALLVSGIAAAADKAGIRVSKSEHSKFAALCRCVFEAAGIYQDPRGSIRAYMQGHNSHPKTGI